MFLIIRARYSERVYSYGDWYMAAIAQKQDSVILTVCRVVNKNVDR